MSYYTINGTSGVDMIEAQEVADSLSYYAEGIIIYGLDGDDELTSTIVGEDRIDEVYGGGGNDWMAADAIDTGFASVLLDGEDGSDHVYLPFSIQGIIKVPGTGIEFSGTSRYGGAISVLVSYRNEIITDITGANYLVEDLSRDNVRAVSWNEAFTRSFNGNQDWFFRGLNTYNSYHSPKPTAAKQLTEAAPPAPVTDSITGKTVQGTTWLVPSGSGGKYKKWNSVKKSDFYWMHKGKKKYSPKTPWLVDSDVKVYSSYNGSTDSLRTVDVDPENIKMLGFDKGTILYSGANVIGYFPNYSFGQAIADGGFLYV